MYLGGLGTVASENALEAKAIAIKPPSVPSPAWQIFQQNLTSIKALTGGTVPTPAQAAAAIAAASKALAAVGGYSGSAGTTTAQVKAFGVLSNARAIARLIYGTPEFAALHPDETGPYGAEYKFFDEYVSQIQPPPGRVTPGSYAPVSTPQTGQIILAAGEPARNLGETWPGADTDSRQPWVINRDWTNLFRIFPREDKNLWGGLDIQRMATDATKHLEAVPYVAMRDFSYVRDAKGVKHYVPFTNAEIVDWHLNWILGDPATCYPKVVRDSAVRAMVHQKMMIAAYPDTSINRVTHYIGSNLICHAPEESVSFAQKAAPIVQGLITSAMVAVATSGIASELGPAISAATDGALQAAGVSAEVAGTVLTDAESAISVAKTINSLAKAVMAVKAAASYGDAVKKAAAKAQTTDAQPLGIVSTSGQAFLPTTPPPAVVDSASYHDWVMQTILAGVANQMGRVLTSDEIAQVKVQASPLVNNAVAIYVQQHPGTPAPPVAPLLSPAAQAIQAKEYQNPAPVSLSPSQPSGLGALLTLALPFILSLR